MEKYLTITATSLKEYFVYRLNFVLWRVRAFIGTIITFFLWSAVFEKNTSVYTYEKSSFLSYILYANLIVTFVFGTRTADIAQEINDGSIMNRLLKPVPFFHFFFARDIADKLLNLSFGIIEMALIVVLFHVNLTPPHNILLFFILLVNGVLISFFINIMLSSIGFWSSETWGPRFLFFMVIFFLSGSMFPLDILPRPVYLLLVATPFPYLFYLPARVLIGKTDGFIYLQVALSFFWLFVSWQLKSFIWKKGMQGFSFWGK